MKLYIIILPIVSCINVETTDKYLGYKDHALVKKSEYFPYTAAILKKSRYISAGALIHENWVLTAADALFFLQEVKRLIQVRLGSTNYRKGGILLPCKFFEIHPMFDDRKPQYDIALIRLPSPVSITMSAKPIMLEKTPGMDVSHFTVTAWHAYSPTPSSSHYKIESMEVITQRRILTVSHLHQSEKVDCEQVLGNYSINGTDSVICLEPADGNETTCSREVGAPIVYNGFLHGIISSWRPEECKPSVNLVVANVVTTANIRDWIHTTIHDQDWKDELKNDYGSNSAVSDYMDTETLDYEDLYFKPVDENI